VVTGATTASPTDAALSAIISARELFNISEQFQPSLLVLKERTLFFQQSRLLLRKSLEQRQHLSKASYEPLFFG
jgi:hypothetical protein